MNLQGTTSQARFLCFMYSIQSRHRIHGLAIDNVPALLAETCKTLDGSLFIFMTMCQTEFIIQPSVQAAMQLLSSYHRDGMILNIFAPHWIYKAASYVIEHANEVNTILQCSIFAAQVFERCAAKWPSSRTLQESIQNLSTLNRLGATTR